jgi:hypothetical protein
MKIINKTTRKKLSCFFTPDNFLVFAASIILFSTIIFWREVPTDIQQYPLFIQRIKAGEMLPPANFVYYLIIYVLALANTSTNSLYISSIIALSLAVTAKFYITRKFYIKQMMYREDEKQTSSSDENTISPNYSKLIIIIFSVLMLLSFSIPGDKFWYLGQIPSNVWHNATTIFLMPFALLLFLTTYKQLIEPSHRNNITIAVLCILNVLIKPSFFFVIAIVYPVFSLKYLGFTKRFVLNLLPIFFGLVMVFLLYYWFYVLNLGNFNPVKSGISIKPFSVWMFFSSNPFKSLLISLIFPICYSLFYWKEFFVNTRLQYSTALYLFSLFLFIMMTETGPREFDGNFFWQCVVSSYIFFMVISSLLLKNIYRIGILNVASVTLLFVYVLHSVSGLLYIVNFMETKNVL